MTKLLFLLLLLSISISISVSVSVSQSQASTLLSIKEQWGNPASLSSWGNATSPCTSWAGITCSPSSVVTSIALSNFNISDPIPESICDLTSLTALDLSWNFIPGAFPTALYRCSSLSLLNLSANYFNGSLPDDLHNLSPLSLQSLDLSDNNFSGDVPASVGGLKELRTLFLSNNLLEGTFPPEIGNLSKIQDLEMAFNPFTPMALHPHWGQLRNLRTLFMADCNLVGEIPPSFGGMESLEHLDLSISGGHVVVNGIHGPIPPALFLLKNLTTVYLQKNKLSGELPSLIQSLSLIDLDLSQNNLTGRIPEALGNLASLRELHLFSNHLEGEIPSSIGRLPRLQILRLFNNTLSGPLPQELGLHSPLQELEVGGNRLSGPLPPGLCSNGAFVGVTAFFNNLSGEIPESLGDCRTLRNLMLYNNDFTGEVPRGIWTLPDVYILMLSFNRFTGQLPDHIAWNLTRIDVDHNHFSGSIPEGIASWTNIHVFNAGNNILSGTLPLGLTSLPNLITLSLKGNQLSGPLPAEVNSWASLTTLDLSGNRLSGSIPAAICTVSSLLYLDLSSNDLSGEIPFQLSKLKQLSSLNLSSNELTGEIPYAFQNQAFSDSFLNNTHLCTSDESQMLSLPKCSNSVITSSSKHMPGKYLAIILVLATVMFLLGLYFTLSMINELRQRKHGSKLTSWKLTSFQRLEFTEANIVSSLSEQNVIGSGGSGKVYRVPITRSSKIVAVKKIWNNQALNSSQFLTEVQILGTIRHSNIVKLLCCVCSEETKLLVYEYLANQSLDKWLHQRRRSESDSAAGENIGALDWPKRMKIAIDAAQGLYYLHHDCSPQIIHRDVKSSNILLDSDFNAKIADFGLARITGKQGQLPTTPDVAGSFGYMAPECRYTNKVSAKMDVYSFGVVLLELATGKEANGDEHLNLAESSWKHYKDEGPIGEVLDEEIKQHCHLEAMAGVFKLGLMCTSTLPSSRPSMKEVLQVLRRFSPPPEEEDSRKPKNTERDVAPLLMIGNGFSSYKSRSTRAVEEDDAFSMV